MRDGLFGESMEQLRPALFDKAIRGLEVHSEQGFYFSLSVALLLPQDIQLTVNEKQTKKHPLPSLLPGV